MLAESSLLLTVSRYTAEQAVRLSGGLARAEVLRPALEVGRYASTQAGDAAAARAALGLDDAPLIVCVGRLVARKGQDMLIAALADLDGGFPDVRLALVGGGRLADELRRQAAAAGVADRVHLPGEVSADELRLWLQAADIFAAPRARASAVSRSRASASSTPRRRSPACRWSPAAPAAHLRLWSKVRRASWSTPTRPTS